VLVKSLLSHHDVYQAEFYREVDVFSRVSHDHVARLLGVCREMEPLFLITEYCEWVSHSLLAVASRAREGRGAKFGLRTAAPFEALGRF